MITKKQTKAVLVISDVNDLVTQQVVAWINQLSGQGINITRVNLSDALSIPNISLPAKNDCIIVDHKNISLASFDYILYRRGWLNFNRQIPQQDASRLFDFFLASETGFINAYIFESYKDKMLSNYLDERISKLTMLELAAKLSIDIPRTLITGLKGVLTTFFLDCQKKIITKAIQNGGIQLTSNITGGAGTFKVTKPVIDKLPETFAPSLFQEQIEKLYEIRTFYLAGKCYSAAIFSQSSHKTKIDFRNYDWESPNRTVPYKLPPILECKLSNLFERLNLRTGSADFIKGKNGKYYFLEINPVGQFSQVSKPCNYQLEKRMAVYITDKVYEDQTN